VVVGAEGEANSPGPIPRSYDATLSDLDRDVLALIASGARDRDIATSTGMPLHAVKRRVRQLLIRLAAKNRTEAVVRALNDGLLR
jgi:DNA-binding NarL/FixJ family response regulator